MQIHLDPEIYDQVKNDTKNVEARVNDEKRRRRRNESRYKYQGLYQVINRLFLVLIQMFKQIIHLKRLSLNDYLR